MSRTNETVVGTTIHLRVVRLGKAVHQLAVPPGTTLADALAMLGVDRARSAAEVRVNGEIRPDGWTPVEGDIVTIVPPVRGGHAAVDARARGRTHGDGPEDQERMADFYTTWLEQSEANRVAVANGPRVARAADLEWVATPQDASAALMVAPEVGFATGGSLLYRAVIPVGWHTGRHRHGEEAIYVEDGDGIVVLDGQAYDFHPGTVIHVPFRSEHQLFNTGAGDVGYISSMSWPVERATNMGFIEQSENAGPTPGGVVEALTLSASQCWPRDGRRLTLHREQYVRAPYSDHGETYYLMRGKQLREQNGFHTVGTSISHIFVELPGSKSHRHRHPEAYLYVLEGEGYTIMDGQRHEWKKGDVVHVPPGMVEHQHFNPTDQVAKELRFEFGLRYWFVDQWEGYRSVETEAAHGHGHE